MAIIDLSPKAAVTNPLLLARTEFSTQLRNWGDAPMSEVLKKNAFLDNVSSTLDIYEPLIQRGKPNALNGIYDSLLTQLAKKPAGSEERDIVASAIAIVKRSEEISEAKAHGMQSLPAIDSFKEYERYTAAAVKSVTHLLHPDKADPVTPIEQPAAAHASIQSATAAPPAIMAPQENPQLPLARTETIPPKDIPKATTSALDKSNKKVEPIAPKPPVTAKHTTTEQIDRVHAGQTLTEVAQAQTASMRKLRNAVQGELGKNATNGDVLNVLAIVLANQAGISNIDRVKANQAIYNVTPESVKDIVGKLKANERVDAKGHIQPAAQPREVEAILAPRTPSDTKPKGNQK